MAKVVEGEASAAALVSRAAPAGLFRKVSTTFASSEPRRQVATPVGRYSERELSSTAAPPASCRAVAGWSACA